MITRPLLADGVEDFNDIRFPVLATPKLDGIRVLKVGGQVLTRKFKPLPNNYTRKILQEILPDGIDGEILLLSNKTVTNKFTAGLGIEEDEELQFKEGQSPTSIIGFNQIQSEIMSENGEPNFVYYAFDYVKESLDTPYELRMKDLLAWHLLEQNVHFKDRILPLLPVKINNLEELMSYEQECVAKKYEGIMIRSPEGRYKCGRSTAREGILLKIKRFYDAEAVVIGFEEKMHNTNVQEINELGLSKRSHKKEGLVPANTLGTLLVKSPDGVMEFGIGSGFDDKTKKEIWDNRDKYLGKMVTYKFQEIGSKGNPRFPVFKGFRSELDIS